MANAHCYTMFVFHGQEKMNNVSTCHQCLLIVLQKLCNTTEIFTIAVGIARF